MLRTQEVFLDRFSAVAEAALNHRVQLGISPEFICKTNLSSNLSILHNTYIVLPVSYRRCEGRDEGFICHYGILNAGLGSPAAKRKRPILLRGGSKSLIKRSSSCGILLRS